jgi:hypothetical protein
MQDIIVESAFKKGISIFKGIEGKGCKAIPEKSRREI